MPTISKQTTKRTKVSRNGEARSAWDYSDGIKMLVYGRSGTGKTTLWATFPGPILALVCSGGNRPGELRSINTEEYRNKITANVIDSVDQLREQLFEAGDYATVVLDHVSGFSDLVIKELLGLDEIPVGKSRLAGKGESWSLVSQQQYGQMTIICKEVLRDLLTLPNNAVIVGQERTFGGKDDGVPSDLITPTIGVAVTPSLAGWLNPACDYVVQTFIRPRMEPAPNIKVAGKDKPQLRRGKGVEYCIRTEPHDIYMTKFRVPKGTPLPPVIVDPTYDKIVALING